MGQGIFYCGACQRQLRSSDLDKGDAVQVDAQILCRTCAPADWKGPPVPASPPPSTWRAKSDTPRTARVAPPRPPTPWVPLGIVGGLAILGLLFAVAASTGPRPAPRAETPTAPGEIPAPVVVRPKDTPPAPPPPRPPVERPQPPAIPAPPPAPVPAPPTPKSIPAPVPTEAFGPVAWWRLTDRSGGTAADSAGAFPGRLEGTAAWSTDPPALKLTGGKGGVALSDNANLLRKAPGATFAAWILPEGDASGKMARSRIVTIDRGAVPLRPRLAISIYSDGRIDFEGRALDAEPDTRVAATTARIAPDRWQHVALALDYGNKAVLIYIDGKRVDTQGKVHFSAAQTSDTPAATAALGAWGNLLNQFFRGLLSDVRLYARPLDGKEIAELAATPPGPSSAPGTRPAPASLKQGNQPR